MTSLPDVTTGQRVDGELLADLIEEWAEELGEEPKARLARLRDQGHAGDGLRPDLRFPELWRGVIVR